jgi:predicted DNA-binding transcriptional regulator
MKRRLRGIVSRKLTGPDRTRTGRPTQKARKVKAFRVYLDLVETAEAVRRVLEGQMATFGMTLEEFRFLEMLYRNGAMRTDEARKQRACTRQNVIQLANSMAERGLVKREVIELPLADVDQRKLAVKLRGRDRQGQKVSEIGLTAAGQRFVGQVLPRHMKMVLAVLRTLNWQEQETLSRICGKLRDWDAFKLLQELEWEDAED